MYTVELVEHFEDWYVAEETIGEFGMLDKAILEFRKQCDELLGNRFSSEGIDGTIAENFDDEDLSDYSKGFVVLIRDEDTFISCHFDYDHRTNSIVRGHLIEFAEEELREFDLSNFEQSLTRNDTGSS